MIIKKNLIHLFKNFVILNTVLIAIFSRSFIGIYLGNFRIGEYIVAVGLLSLSYALINYKKLEKLIDYRILKNIFFIVVSFSFFVVLNQDSLTDTYTFKSSMYIWMLGYFFIGFVFGKNLNINKFYLYLLNLIIFILYFLKLIYYPEWIISFFLQYSDKFQFNKSSDIFIVLVVTLWLNNRSFEKKYSVPYLIFIFFLFIPLFLVLSRGSAIGFVIFFIIELIYHRNSIDKYKKNIILILLFSPIPFLFTTNIIVKDETIQEEGISSMVENILETKNTTSEALFLYIQNNRLISSDGNLNWRLQIWQDILQDSKNQFNYLKGQEFDQKILAMNKIEYQGEDNLNENVHNYFFNIFARGGLIHLFLYVILYYFFIFGKNKKIELISFILPILFVSMFDASMESPQFSYIFFLFLGLYTVKMENMEISTK